MEELLKALEATISPEQKEKELAIVRQVGLGGEPDNTGITIKDFVAAVENVAANYEPVYTTK